jgi:hypothetical protein
MFLVLAHFFLSFYRWDITKAQRASGRVVLKDILNCRGWVFENFHKFVANTELTTTVIAKLI